MKGGPIKRLLLGRNSGAAVSGGKTAGETRTGTGGDGLDERVALGTRVFFIKTTNPMLKGGTV